jgi:hypothetical protein
LSSSQSAALASQLITPNQKPLPAGKDAALNSGSWLIRGEGLAERQTIVPHEMASTNRENGFGFTVMNRPELNKIHVGCKVKGHPVLKVRSILKFAAMLCLMLTFWSAFAVVAHHHPKGTESAKCSVCVAAHSVSPKAGVNVLKATFISISVFRADPVSAKERFVAFALSVRPPPTTA